MKKLIFILFLFGIAQAQYKPVNRGEPLKITAATTGVFSYTMWSYQRFDYRLHVAAMYTVGTLTGRALRNKKRHVRFLATLGTGLAVITTKETIDYLRGGRFSKDDFLYGLTGLGIGIAITL
jgi:hypothetical protein